jgi:putative ABC transport system permease protein
MSLQDIRYAILMIRKSPGFSFAAVLALALGIGATSAIFSVINAIVLRPLPFNDPERLVAVWESAPDRDVREIPISYANFRDWAEQNTSFEHMAAYIFAGVNFNEGTSPERIAGLRVSASLFPLLKTGAAHGRVFSAEEDTAADSRVVVLSHRLWERRFGMDPNIVGRAVTLDGKPHTVIGVMPRSFQFPVGFSYNNRTYNDPIEVYMPIGSIVSQLDRGSRSAFAIARLNSSATFERAQTDIETIQARLQEQYPDANPGIGAMIVPLHEQTVSHLRTALAVLFVAVAFVLLIACVNVANLLLARSAARQKEMAIRSALGASRARIIRQLITESILLALVGGVAGLLLALWGGDALMAIGPENIPRAGEVSIDAGVIAFTAGVSLLTGLLFGLAPALQASKPNLNEMLKEGGRSSSGGARKTSLLNALVVVEIAMSLVLLIGAGLMLKSFYNLYQVESGFNPENVIRMRVSLSGANYAEPEALVAFQQRAIENIRSLPGVEYAAATNMLPLDGNFSIGDFFIEGRPIPRSGEEMMAGRSVVSSDYFRALGITLLSGREFNDRDSASSTPVAIINRGLANQYFPGEDPLGKRIAVEEVEDREQPPWITIVGVVADAKRFGLDSDAMAEIFLPFLQDPQPNMTLVARTSSDPTGLAGAIKDQILLIDKDQPVYAVQTMKQLLSESVSRERFNMTLLAVFAAVALVLAAVGVYGVMSYSVAERRHEIGIRMALGASSSDVLGMILKQSAVLAFAGLGIGIFAAVMLTRLMTGLLYEVSATDGATFAVVSALLAGVALAATYIPARRATRIDPMIALRHE